MKTLNELGLSKLEKVHLYRLRFNANVYEFEGTLHHWDSSGIFLDIRDITAGPVSTIMAMNSILHDVYKTLFKHKTSGCSPYLSDSEAIPFLQRLVIQGFEWPRKEEDGWDSMEKQPLTPEDVYLPTDSVGEEIMAQAVININQYINSRPTRDYSWLD